MADKVQVAKTSAIAGGTLALLKLTIGILSGSLALTSEGIHSSLDFFVTLATWLSVKTSDVPVGLLMVRIGGSRFVMADPIAAMVVAAVMIFTALRLGRRSADVLVDRAPEGVEQEVQGLIHGVPGVRGVSRVRARQGGAR